MLYRWTLKLFKTGNKRDLIENDLYATLEDHTSSSLGSRIEKLNYRFKKKCWPNFIFLFILLFIWF